MREPHGWPAWHVVLTNSRTGHTYHTDVIAPGPQSAEAQARINLKRAAQALPATLGHPRDYTTSQVTRQSVLEPTP